MHDSQYIVVAGSIGVGKTTTVEALVRTLQSCVGFYEFRDRYLQRFYDDPTKFAFLNQLAYSLQYLEQASEIASLSCHAAQDRSIYDTHQVFSQWRRDIGLIHEDEFELLARIFRAADRIVRPTLMVLLDAPVDVAMARIKQRRLATEMDLTTQFLEELSDQYMRWFDVFDLCPKLKLCTDKQAPHEVVQAILRALRMPVPTDFPSAQGPL